MRAALFALLFAWPAISPSAGLGAGLIAASDAAPRGSRQYEQWRKADSDRDGALSRMEAARMPRLAASFDAIDSDADSRISADEVRTWRRASAQARRSPKRRAVDGFLALADANGDGLLSRAETLQRLPRLAAKFARIDADGSGALSRDEIDAWFALRRAARRRASRARPATAVS